MFFNLSNLLTAVILFCMYECLNSKLYSISAAPFCFNTNTLPTSYNDLSSLLPFPLFFYRSLTHIHFTLSLSLLPSFSPFFLPKSWTCFDQIRFSESFSFINPKPFWLIYQPQVQFLTGSSTSVLDRSSVSSFCMVLELGSWQTVGVMVWMLN